MNAEELYYYLKGVRATGIDLSETPIVNQFGDIVMDVQINIEENILFINEHWE